METAISNTDLRHPDISYLLELVRKSENGVKLRKSKKVPVPYKWYNEMVNEYARDLMDTIRLPRMQYDRIQAVENSNGEYEVLKHRNVSLAELIGFYDEMLSKTLKKYQRLQ